MPVNSRPGSMGPKVEAAMRFLQAGGKEAIITSLDDLAEAVTGRGRDSHTSCEEGWIMKLRHVVESQQFTVPLLLELFDRTRAMERIVARGGTLDYQHKIMASLFYEPSTRTRICFEAAMHRLGGRVCSTDQAKIFSSEVEGEQLEDTIRIISGYTDVIVLRHSERGGAARAAAVSKVPVINAGDGSGGQHPTQALLDLYTIFRERRTLDGLSIAMVGELDRGRTVRSLAYLLSKFDRVKMYFVSPPEVQMKRDILEHLEEQRIWYTQESELDRVIGEVDVDLRHADPARPHARPAAPAEVFHGCRRSEEDEAECHDPAPAAAHRGTRQGGGQRFRALFIFNRQPTVCMYAWRF